MDISCIRDFFVLAKFCNYSQAADELFISRSTLFSHIKALESDLKASLFVRSGKGIVLSEQGRKFIPYAKRIIDEYDEYLSVIKDDREPENAVIRIGLQYRIQELIRDFRQAYKSYKIHSFSMNGTTEPLDTGDSDLAFIRNMTDLDEKYDSISFIRDHVVAAVHAEHPIANHRSISLFELRNEDFVMIAKDNMAIHLCENAGFFPRVVMTTETAHSAAALVDWGMGITLFMKESSKYQNTQNMVLVDIDPPIECHISLCWLKEKKLSTGEKRFIEFAKNYHSSNE